MDERAVPDARPHGYVPPPAFAPPALRIAPLNEYQVLGRSSYPRGAQSYQSAQWAAYYANGGPRYGPPQAYAGSTYAPVPWHPALGAAATSPTISRKLTVLVAGAVVAALIAVVALVSNSSPPGHTSRSLAVPDAAGDYSLVSKLSGAQISALGAGAFGSFPAADLAKARIGLFSRTAGAPTLVFVGFLADDSPTIGAQLRNTEPITVVDEVFAGTDPSATPTPLDPGPLGGALEVATIDVGGQQATAAVWADADTLGLVLDESPNRPGISEMATIALAMRAAAEK